MNYPNKCRHGFETSDDCCEICCLESELEAANSRIEELATELKDEQAELSTANETIGRYKEALEYYAQVPVSGAWTTGGVAQRALNPQPDPAP
jgi:hypothetical protein